MANLTDNMRGAGWMTLCMVAFTINDAIMKSVFADVPFFQALFLRGLFSLVLMTVLAARAGALVWPPLARDRKLIAIRTLAEIAGVFLFMTALLHMPIANVSAILQALPLTVTLAAALLFGEPLGWRRLLAIGVGFFGVLLIVRPGVEGFSVYSVFALGAVVAVTFRDLAARRLSAGVHTLSVAFAMAAGIAVTFGAGALVTEWREMDTTSILKLVAAGGFVLVGYISSVRAMRIGSLSFIAPFRYTSLLTALVLGFAMFGEWPRTLTLIGALIVVATGCFTLWRERRMARAPRAVHGLGHPAAPLPLRDPPHRP